MNAYRITLVLALSAIACQRGGGGPTSTGPSSTASTPATVAPALATATATAEVQEAAPLPGDRTDKCTPGQKIAPGTLAASWPARLETRVRFKSRVEFSLDVMDAVVTAAGHRFVVVAGPDQLWAGEKERNFTVMGSKDVAIGGPTTLPQLLLDEECPP